MSRLALTAASSGRRTETNCASRQFEAWRQVWTSIGAEMARLRISRMWPGQPRPQPTTTLHVIVATIQTLNAKLSAASGRVRNSWRTSSLSSSDEAHRSVAPTFTSVMREIGLTRWKRSDEPFLLGLTATPYRGHDAEETARLVHRYGSNRLDAGAFESDNPQEVIMGVAADARARASRSRNH